MDGDGVGTVTGFAAPLAESTQFEGARFELSCNTKPGVDGVHETVAWPGAAGRMVRSGAPADCTAIGKAQKPPVTENCPLVSGPPASDCPMVPVTA